jgi:hypothetical protein
VAFGARAPAGFGSGAKIGAGGVGGGG